MKLHIDSALIYGEKSIKITGFGCQGVLSMGITLADAGMKAKRHLSYYPSYGSEQRGGASNCVVVFSGSVIGSPALNKVDPVIS